MEALIYGASGDMEQVVECTESCTLTASEDSLIQIAPTASDGANFLGWNRNPLQETCRGTGVCDFLLYGEYEIDVEFSTSQAAIEVANLDISNLPISYSGSAVSYQGISGDGQCNDSECLFVAEIGTEIIFDTGSERTQWHELGACGDQNIACTVLLSDTPGITATVERNKWYGVSLEDTTGVP